MNQEDSVNTMFTIYGNDNKAIEIDYDSGLDLFTVISDGDDEYCQIMLRRDRMELLEQAIHTLLDRNGGTK